MNVKRMMEDMEKEEEEVGGVVLGGMKAVMGGKVGYAVLYGRVGVYAAAVLDAYMQNGARKRSPSRRVHAE